jgi:hypothetical protein
MGFKKTSEELAISFSVAEDVVDTFAQEEIALQLDILNNEVFVVLAIDLDPTCPSNIAGINTQTQMSLTTTTQTAVQLLSNTNCLAEERINIRQDAGSVTGVLYRASNGSTPVASLDYLGIIATNNFFIQLKGSNNAAVQTGTGRLWGYRARADAQTYAALVQSEVLSA